MVSQARIQLIGTNTGYLDIKSGTAFPINLSLGDIRDISKRNGSYSRTITLVGNKNNSILLGHYYDLNVEAGTFNINTLQKCLIEQDGVVILDNMYMQLTSIKKIQKAGSYEIEVEYEVEVKDSSSDFFIKINNLELTNLDMSVYNHTYAVSGITGSFDNTYVDGYKYLMPYIAPTDLNPNAYKIQDFKPGIYGRIYWDQIFDNAGYTYDFQEASGSTIQFDKLFIPYNGDVPKPIEDQDSWVVASATTAFTKTDNSLPTAVKQQMIIDGEISDVSNYYNPVLGEYTTPSTIANPDSYIFEFAITYSVSIKNNNVDSIKIQNVGVGGAAPKTKAYGIKLLSNNNEVNGTMFPVPAATILAPAQTYVLATNYEEVLTTNNSNINANTIIETYFNTNKDTNASFWASTIGLNQLRYVDITVTISSIKMTIKPSLNTFLYGSNITMNSFIPKKIKQSEFIKSICQMYNLYIETDPTNPTNLIVRTRDEFYDSGVVVDWTKKLAKDKEQNIKFLPELSSKKLILSYKPDKDTANANYEAITNEVYGQVEYTFDNEYVKNTDRKDLIFSPTPNAYTNFQANVPILVGQAPKVNIRILLDNGLYSCQPYTITESGTSVSTTTYTTYPLLSHFNDAENPTFDINYAVCDYYFYNPDSLTNNNLYNLHWRRTLGQINNGKLLTALFDLNAVDIQKLKLNDKIRIDNGYWNINKVIDYDANSNNLTKVELISIDDDLELPPFDTYGITETTPTGNVFLPAPGDIYLQGLGDIKNNTGKGNSDYANIDASNGAVNITGKNNQTSNLVTGSITGDQNILNGIGKALIYGNQNTINSPSLIYGTNNIVEENLSNVFIFVDSYTATTSDIFVTPENLIIDGPDPTINGIPLSAFTGTTTGLTWSDVLTNGNTSGPNNAVMDTTQVISSSNGGGQLALDAGGTASNVLLSVDGGIYSGLGHLNMYQDFIELVSDNYSKAIYIINTGFGDGIWLQSDENVFSQADTVNTTLGNYVAVLGQSSAHFGLTEQIITQPGYYESSDIDIYDTLSSGVTSDDDKNAVFISTQNSSRDIGVKNTAIIGGSGLTATQDNTVYVPYLNIRDLSASTAVTNLAIDANGYVVSGGASTGSTPTSSTWADVLANGNTSAGNDVIITNGDILKSEVGSTLNIQSDTLMDIRFDDGLGDVTQLYMESLYASLGIDNGTSGLEFDTNNNFNIINNNIDLTANNSTVKLYTKNNSLSLGSSASKDEIIILNNSAANRTSTATDNNAVFIGTNASTINTGTINSVVIGGGTNIISSGLTGGVIIASNLSTLNATKSAIIAADNFTSPNYTQTLYSRDGYHDAFHTITTVNNTTTTIYSFTPNTNGVWVVEANVTAFRTATGDALGAKVFATFKVIGGVVTLVGAQTLDRKSNFPATVTVALNTNGTIIRLQATGLAAATIDWRSSLTITK